jgi:hypothetical protein
VEAANLGLRSGHDEEVDRMKWVAIGLGASILALAAGAYALTAGSGA